MAIELTSRYGVDKNHLDNHATCLIKPSQILPIPYKHMASKSLIDITTGIHPIMKVKEYRFHVPIHPIFWELQVTERIYCNTKDEINVPGFRIRYGGALRTVKSVVRVMPNPSGHSRNLPG
jgi:hypothetical protein